MRRTIIVAILLVALMSVAASAAGSSSLVWKTPAAGITDSSISGAGLIAVSAGDAVMAFKKDGSKVWEWKAGAEVRHIAYGISGELYVAYRASITKLDDKGHEEWTKGTFEEMAYSLAVLPDGRPVLGYSRGVLCFEQDGGVSWDHYAHEECDT